MFGNVTQLPYNHRGMANQTLRSIYCGTLGKVHTICNMVGTANECGKELLDLINLNYKWEWMNGMNENREMIDT